MAATPEPSTAPRDGEPRRRRGLLPLGKGERRPPVWWQELAFIGVSYVLYGAIRNHLGNPQPVECAEAVTKFQRIACGRAYDLLHVERVLHLDVELALNRVTASSEWIAVPMNYWYALAHFVVTIGVLVWLYRRHPLQYRPMRTALYVCNAVALLGYWFYSLAPPRFLPEEGYVDTFVVFNTWGAYTSGGEIETVSNQYAAMPSMHVAWAVWAGLAMFWLGRRRRVRWSGIVYPVLTLVVIMATANHFILDAVGGVVALWLGFLAQRALSGQPAVDQSVARPPLTAPLGSTPPTTSPA